MKAHIGGRDDTYGHGLFTRWKAQLRQRKEQSRLIRDFVDSTRSHPLVDAQVAP